MSTAIVLPTLTQWVKNHITAIIEAQTPADLQSAVDAFLSKDATLVVNGAPISRAAFVQQLEGLQFEEQSASVAFSGAVAVPKTAGDNFTAGSVGVFYTANIVEKIRVLGAPITKQISASLNVVIEQDPSIPKPPSGPVHGFFDPRRVKSLNEVSLQTQVSNTASSA